MKARYLVYGSLATCLMIGIYFSIYYLIETTTYEQAITEASTDYSSIPEHHFVLISEELAHEYWKLVERGAKEAEAHYGVYVEYTGPQNSNPEEQVRLFEMAIAKKVDGIIVQALNEEMFTPLIDQAIDHGIPVITIDTDEPNSSRIAYVGTDNYRSGQLAGQALIEDLAGEISIGIISSSFASSHQLQRVQGFIDVVEQYENVEVVAMEESNNSRIGAAEKADLLLGEYPEITAFYGTSALDGLGIASSLSTLGREDIYIIAFDSLDESLDLLNQGKIDVIISQEPYEMGFRSVCVMLDIINGKVVDDLYHTNTRIIRQLQTDD